MSGPISIPIKICANNILKRGADTVVLIRDCISSIPEKFMVWINKENYVIVSEFTELFTKKDNRMERCLYFENVYHTNIKLVIPSCAEVMSKDGPVKGPILVGGVFRQSNNQPDDQLENLPDPTIIKLLPGTKLHKIIDGTRVTIEKETVAMILLR